jgi:hypothetical protein
MKNKKQTYSKVIPALALLGGAYLLLNKSAPTSNSNTGGSTGSGPFVPSPTNTTSLPIFNQGSGDNSVSGYSIYGTEESSMNPDYSKWRGYEWYLYVQKLSEKMPKKEAISLAFSNWNNPENKYYRLMPTEPAFLMGLAMAERMPYQGMKDFVESGDYSGIYTSAISINGSAPITWDSQPVYDTLYGWWYNVTPWDCEDWTKWHRELERHYNSTQRANDIWKAAWFDDQNSVFNSVVWNYASYCPYDCSGFVTYFASKGITNIQGFDSAIYCGIANVGSAIIGAVQNTADAVETTTKILKYAVPVVALAFGYYAYRRYLAPQKNK